MILRITFLFSLFTWGLVAQNDGAIVAEKLSFVTQKAHFDKQEELGVSVVIPLANFAEIERNFEKHIDDFTKAKVEHIKGSYRLSPMEWPEVCDTGSVYYGHFEDSEFGLVWLSAIACRDRFIQPNDAKAWTEMNRMIMVFAYEVYDDAFSKVVKDQEKRVKDQKKAISQLENERGRMEKAISNNTKHIEALEQEIHDYDAELEALNASISKVRAERVALTEKEEIKASKAREKKMNKDRDKARKQQNKRRDQIQDMNVQISESQQRIIEIDELIPQESRVLLDEENELLRLKGEYENLKGFAGS